YRCKEGHVVRARGVVDDYVRLFVAEWLRSPVVGNLDLTDDRNDDPASVEVAAQRARLAKVEADYDADLIDGRRYAVKRAKILAELKAAETVLRRSRSGSALAGIASAADPVAAFE